MSAAYSKIAYGKCRCFRLALKEDQGLGWSEYGGEDWIWPEEEVQPTSIVLGNGQVKEIALDETTGKFYWMSTYDGPTGSGLSTIWLDKESDYAGSEIPWEMWHKERTGTDEYERIQSAQINHYLRPQS